MEFFPRNSGHHSYLRSDLVSFNLRSFTFIDYDFRENFSDLSDCFFHYYYTPNPWSVLGLLHMQKNDIDPWTDGFSKSQEDTNLPGCDSGTKLWLVPPWTVNGILSD